MKRIGEYFASTISRGIFLSAVLSLSAAGALVARAGERPVFPEYFSFHNSFWMNLHQTLYHEAVVRWLTAEQQRQRSDRPLNESALTPPERQAWERAIAFYQSRYKGRRLLFDPELISLIDALSQQENSADLKAAQGLPADLVSVVEQAAPVYRRHWWTEHRESNQLWIERMQPLVRQFSRKVIPQLELFLQSRWPGPDRVDVSYFVAELGSAYTLDQEHTIIGSSRDANSGYSGLETVFHEAAHLLTSRLYGDLDQQCQIQQADCGDLWHAVQFFTVGEVVQKEFRKAGIADYQPYALKYGLYERGRWPVFLTLIKKEWEPYLEGKTTFPAALRAMSAGLKQH